MVLEFGTSRRPAAVPSPPASLPTSLACGRYWMISRRFISQLGESENVDQVFLVSEKQLRANRNGNLYLQMRLADRTGTVNGMMWNANDQVYGSFDNGDYLRVVGTTQFYNGNLQLIVNRLERMEPARVDEADFVTIGQQDVDRMATRVAELLRGMQDPHLRTLADCFLMDETFMRKFTHAPAGVKHHHAYRGGLLQHVLSLMELTRVVAPRYPEVNADLLLFGAFIHDTGKVDELEYERDLTYSDEGQLVGHLVIGVEILNAKAEEAERLSGEPFPVELLLRLKHIVVSHHGQYEFGSPKLPMTLEAVALHYLDNLDAKLFTVGQLIREDVNSDSDWTTYQPALGRKFYKPSLGEADVDDR
jgi:3'-5' exoribonuclease